MCTKICTENLKERDSLGDLCADGRMLLRHFKEINWEGLDWVCFAQDTAMRGMCEHSNEP
jgi:hypothetical protein